MEACSAGGVACFVNKDILKGDDEPLWVGWHVRGQSSPHAMLACFKLSNSTEEYITRVRHFFCLILNIMRNRSQRLLRLVLEIMFSPSNVIR